MELKEEWKPVVGFEKNYLVSNLGNVKRVLGSSHLKPKKLKLIPDKDGYNKVNLKVNQKTNSRTVHRLVAFAFIPNPENKPQVNHINGIKNDNRVENLEWCTLSENRTHAYSMNLQNGLSRRGIKNNFNKLKESDVLQIRNEYLKRIVTYKVLAQKYKVTEGCIGSIIKRKNWSWL